MNGSMEHYLKYKEIEILDYIDTLERNSNKYIIFKHI